MYTLRNKASFSSKQGNISLSEKAEIYLSEVGLAPNVETSPFLNPSALDTKKRWSWQFSVNRSPERYFPVISLDKEFGSFRESQYTFNSVEFGPLNVRSSIRGVSSSHKPKKRMREGVCYTTYGTIFDNMDERSLL